jgi:glycosyltransferase involved in cell wall biosynthesis
VTKADAGRPLLDSSVVFLTHYIPLYQVRVFQEIAKRVREFRLLLSTPLEPNRRFDVDWGGLEVEVQKSICWRRYWRHSVGFADELFVHIPYDTVARLRSLRPDIIVSHELGMRSLAASWYRARNPECRLLLCTFMSEHTEQGRGWLRGRLRRWLLNRCDAVTFNGPSCRRYLKGLGVPDTKLFHFPYAADDRVYGQQAPDADYAANVSRFICVGQLTERKGVLPLVRRMRDYASQRPQRLIHLTLVGEGPLRAALQDVERPGNFSLAIESDVTPARLGELYQQHGLALHPTLADEWLMVVNESLHAGLPVLVSRYAQAAETLIESGVNGWVFDPLEAGDLERNLDTYFGLTSEQWLAMRHAAQRSIAGRTPPWAASELIAAMNVVVKHR